MPLAFITFGFMIVLANLTIGVIFGDPTPIAAGLAQPEVFQATDLILSPLVRLLGILSMLIGGCCYAFGIDPLFPRAVTDPDQAPDNDRARRRSDARAAYSPVAAAASDRVDLALARLRSMPADTFSPEARLEYEAIRDKHLPSLRAAHTTARAAFPADGPDAAAIDADLAGSLTLLAGKLEELIEHCGEEARSGLAVERRFVELRHPSTADPLALSADRMAGGNA